MFGGKMRNIVIVECGSTGINFIQDIVNRNFHPVVLILKNDGSEGAKIYNDMVLGSLEEVEEDFDLIYEKDSYEDTLEMIKGYDPELVVPGSEKGVILATKLASDLNLKGNSAKNIESMTLKHKMQEKLAENNLRHIRGGVVKSVEEAIRYYDEENFSEVVVKPAYSAGSVGVRFCSNKQEMIDNLEDLFKQVNLYGEKNTEYVIQELIKGDEYIVNTVSCEGVHRVTSIWKYHKINTPEGGHIYDYMESVNDLGLGDADLVEYAYDVADALEIEYGPVHGEYMVDENGPVLIEVNCRPMGGNMPAKFLDRITGQHETDSILDSYLNPKKFEFERLRGYQLYEHGALKFFIVPKDLLARTSPMKYISNNLKSHFLTTRVLYGAERFFVKTQDLETTGGTVYLTHPNGQFVHNDIDFLRSIEKNAFDLVLSDELDKKSEIDETESFDDVKYILSLVSAYGNTLFVTDKIFEDVNLLQVPINEIDDVNGEFDCVVVNLNKSIIDKTNDCVAYMFLKIINRVKVGGLIFIPKSTYVYISHGRKSVEAFIKVLDLKIQLPLHDLKGFVIATK